MMNFLQKDILSSSQFKKEDLEHLFVDALKMEKIIKNKEKSNLLEGKILASLFFEPSTRTRFSFESAMMRLGGKVISTTNVQFSSITKGESLEDTGKIVSSYCDIIAMRHWEKGSVKQLTKFSKVPVINAGDGYGEHPTQALLDIFTIKKECNKIDNIKIAMVGDLKFGRTVHSLVNLLLLFKNISFYFISPIELQLPSKIKEKIKKQGIEFHENENLSKIPDDYDVAYITRVQKERFTDKEKYENLKKIFVIDEKFIKKYKNIKIMHPLPRIHEIKREIDKYENAAYFREAENGLFIRMALLSNILGKR